MDKKPGEGVLQRAVHTRYGPSGGGANEGSDGGVVVGVDSTVVAVTLLLLRRAGGGSCCDSNSTMKVSAMGAKWMVVWVLSEVVPLVRLRTRCDTARQVVGGGRKRLKKGWTCLSH